MSAEYKLYMGHLHGLSTFSESREGTPFKLLIMLRFEKDSGKVRFIGINGIHQYSRSLEEAELRAMFESAGLSKTSTWKLLSDKLKEAFQGTFVCKTSPAGVEIVIPFKFENSWVQNGKLELLTNPEFSEEKNRNKEILEVFELLRKGNTKQQMQGVGISGSVGASLLSQSLQPSGLLGSQLNGPLVQESSSRHKRRRPNSVLNRRRHKLLSKRRN